jgi:hypothetical protein
MRRPQSWRSSVGRPIWFGISPSFHLRTGLPGERVSFSLHLHCSPNLTPGEPEDLCCPDGWGRSQYWLGRGSRSVLKLCFDRFVATPMVQPEPLRSRDFLLALNHHEVLPLSVV